ncbi:uncharacterized protein LOC121236708 [Juglans microcarpa x Juglans regia]|uniref:uncharacterized protein LOC121236708 n=1 Tax=Juglans microcarpa x Juglans regia TaxID=2249226 RepID=UPI001B7E381E|nr:uncharacterized protein LOC121236708 [Juglans microcarpa x Juglans regia]
MNSSADHLMVNGPTWSLQTQSASMAKSEEEYKLPNLTSAKVKGTIDASTSQAATQMGMSFVQAPSPGNSHNEIAKLIHKLLQPQHPEHPKWIPQSMDYMNKALTCQMCQLNINEVYNHVLLCDACEKRNHFKCLQPNQNGIPRDTNHVDSVSDIKIPDARENQGNNSASSIKNVGEKPFAGVSINVTLKPLSVGSSSVNSIQHVQDCELSTREEISFEEKIDPPAKVSAKVGNNSYHSLPSHNSHVDWRDLLNYAEVPLKNHPDNDLIVKEPQKAHVRENIDHTSGYDAKQDDQLVSQANPSRGFQTLMGAIEHSGSPSDGLCGVEWIDNVV